MVRRMNLIYETPNIENTIPVSLYQSSSPEKFSIEDDDKFVLYGGGTNYSLSILQSDPTQQLKIHPELEGSQNSTVSLYVLNTSFIIWFEKLEKGLEINYQSIILHALRTQSESSPGPRLYLQLVSSEFLQSIPKEKSEFISSVELVISRDGTEVDARAANALFQIQKQSSLTDIYDALSECSSFHESDDDNDESETPDDIRFDAAFYNGSENSDMQPQALEIPTSWLQGDSNDDSAIDVDEAEENTTGTEFRNGGHADDLDLNSDDEHMADHPAHQDGGAPTQVAGMSVDVGYAPISGSTRRRDDSEDDVNKFKSRKVSQN